jgi:hypothetical protein
MQARRGELALMRFSQDAVPCDKELGVIVSAW